MNGTLILFIIGVLRRSSKGLVRGLEKFEIGGRTETMQATAL